MWKSMVVQLPDVFMVVVTMIMIAHGKAVDMYSYTTMILGATKHLIEKVEVLEKENEVLKNKLYEMEELLNGIINKE